MVHRFFFEFVQLVVLRERLHATFKECFVSGKLLAADSAGLVLICFILCHTEESTATFGGEQREILRRTHMCFFTSILCGKYLPLDPVLFSPLFMLLHTVKGDIFCRSGKFCFRERQPRNTEE